MGYYATIDHWTPVLEQKNSLRKSPQKVLTSIHVTSFYNKPESPGRLLNSPWTYAKNATTTNFLQ